MKKLILILFFPLLLYGQTIDNGTSPIIKLSGTSIQTLNASAPSLYIAVPDTPTETYVKRAQDFFDRVALLGKTLTDAQKDWYNDSIFVPLIDSGLIGTTRAGDSLAVLYSFNGFASGNDTVIMHLNLLDDSYNITGYGTRTYTDSGVVGNGSSGYLSTFFNPVSDSSIWRLWSASFGMYSQTNSAAQTVDMGVHGGNRSNISLKWSDNNQYLYINSTNLYGAAQTSSLGMFVFTRMSSTQINRYINGVYQGSTTANTTGLTAKIFYFLAGNNGSDAPQYYSARCYSFAFVGSGLSTDKARKLSNILNNSLKPRGYDVY